MKNKPIFIISTGGTGGVTLAKVFNMLPNVKAVHEPSPLLLDLSYKKYYNKLVVTYNSWITYRQETIDKINKEGKIYIELNPGLWGIIPELNKIYPNSKFIYVTRDGRDYVRRGMGRGWYTQKREGNYWEEWRIRKTDKDWDKWNQFQKISWFWKEVNEQILKGLESVPTERKLQIRLEDPEFITKIYKWLSFKYNTKYKEAFLVKENVTKDYKIPHWKDWDDIKRKQFNNIAEEMNKRLGY